MDIRHIECLTDREVLEHLPGGFRWLRKNVREDVVHYFEAFAAMLEERLIESIDIKMDQLVLEEAAGIHENQFIQ